MNMGMAALEYTEKMLRTSEQNQRKSGMSPCFVNCGEPACQKLGCIRVYNTENRKK